MEFDPYRQWLSLDDPPRNFYGLLGLQPLEDDTDLIESAASQVISRVRNVKPGNQIGAWKRLLDQIERARDSLCDPVKKQRYDQSLRKRIDAVDVSLTVPGHRLRSTRPTTMTKHVPDPMSPLEDADLPARSTAPTRSSEPAEQAPPVPQRGVASRRVVPRGRVMRRPRSRRSMRWAKPFALLVGAVAFLSVAWALWLVLQSNEQLLSFVVNRQSNSPSVRDRVADHSADSSNLPDAPIDANAIEATTKEPSTVDPSFDDRRADATDSPTARIQTQRRPLLRPHSETTDKPAQMDRPSDSDDSEPAQLTDDELRRLGRLFRNVRRDLRDRQFDESKKYLAEARQLAKTPEVAARVERLETLHQYVHSFWMAVNDGMLDIENSELVVDGKRMFVVEVTPQQIVLRDEGRNRRFHRNPLPTKLAIAIADRWFDQNASSTKVFKGAFMAVAPGYSDQHVRQLWQQAQQEGADVGDLIQVLDDRDWEPGRR